MELEELIMKVPEGSIVRIAKEGFFGNEVYIMGEIRYNGHSIYKLIGKQVTVEANGLYEGISPKKIIRIEILNPQQVII